MTDFTSTPFTKQFKADCDALSLRLAEAAVRRKATSKLDIEKLARDLVAAGESEYDIPTAGSSPTGERT